MKAQGVSEDIRYKDLISGHITKTVDYQNRCKGHKELIICNPIEGGGGGGWEGRGGKGIEYDVLCVHGRGGGGLKRRSHSYLHAAYHWGKKIK